MPMGPMGVVARATDAKLGANGVVFQPGFDGTAPGPLNPEKSIYFFVFFIYYSYSPQSSYPASAGCIGIFVLMELGGV